MHQEYSIKFEDLILKINASHFTSWELQELIQRKNSKPKCYHIGNCTGLSKQNIAK